MLHNKTYSSTKCSVAQISLSNAYKLLCCLLLLEAIGITKGSFKKPAVPKKVISFSDQLKTATLRWRSSN